MCQFTGGCVIHDGSLGFLVQSIGSSVGLHEGSVGFALQSTGGRGVVVLHDGSFGFVLQSIGPGAGSVGLHDGSFGFVLQSTSCPGSDTFSQSGEIDPCSHVVGGCSVGGVGFSVDGPGG